MPTVEELKAKELAEQKRHNRKTEKFSIITSLIGALSPKGSYRMNDYPWYGSPDIDMSKLAEKLSFADPLGLTKRFAHASTCVLEWIPTLGPGERVGANKLELDPLYTSLTEGFRILRKNNVSTSSFTQGEYALYHFAKLFIGIAIMEVLRAIGLSNMKMSNLNRGEAYGIASALHIDWDNFVQYRAEIVNRLNGLISRFNAFVDMPETNLAKRYKLLTTSIIKDHAKSKKNQFYAYAMVMTYKLDVANSGFKPQQWNFIAGSTVPAKIQGGNWLNIIDDMIRQMEESTTMQIINGNISRAIGENGYRINEVQNNGEDLMVNIVEHDEVLCQIQNTDIVCPISGFSDSSMTSTDNWQIKMNASGTSLEYPNGRKLEISSASNTYGATNSLINHNNNTITTILGQDYFDRVILTKENYDILTSYESIPSHETTTVISRNKVVCDGTQLENVDSIVVIGKRFSVYTRNDGYGISSLVSSTKDPLLIIDRLGSEVELNAPGAGDYLETIASITILRKIESQFDWHPWFSYYLDTDTLYFDADLLDLDQNLRDSEYDTFALVLRDQYMNINASCFKNEVALLDVPANSNPRGL